MGPEWAHVRQDFRQLFAHASTADLRRPTHGTKWTNRELLFHMLLGYLITRALLPLTRLAGRRPGQRRLRLAAGAAGAPGSARRGR